MYEVFENIVFPKYYKQSILCSWGMLILANIMDDLFGRA